MKKNITRRMMTALLDAAMCVSIAACGSKTDDTKTDGTGDADGAKKYTICVCQLVEEYLTGKGITCTRYSFSDSNDVAAVTTKAAADSDVIYIPTDNTAASCTETIGSIVLNAKTPVVAGEKGICTGAAVCTMLLLDEHTAALDPQTAQRVMDITDRLVRENHLTTLMITHNMRDAIHYGNRLLMLHNGRIVLDISGEEKARLTVPDLLALFSKVSGQEYDNDRALLA